MMMLMMMYRENNGRERMIGYDVLYLIVDKRVRRQRHRATESQKVNVNEETALCVTMRYIAL